jgi:type IV pilus assembly protein PilQ
MKVLFGIVLTCLLITGMSHAQNEDGGESDPLQIKRAMNTIDAADTAFTERESEVLADASMDEVPAAVTIEPEEPLTVEPELIVPQGDVFLDLPGADAESTAMAVDAETISVDFPEEDVRSIIRSVAELYELNVVIPDALAGSVSIKLRNVTWQQVFEVVLEPLGYTYLMEGNIIKIKSREELALEPVDTRVFIIDFAVAGEIQKSIEPLVDAGVGGKIQVDKRSNALVITERPSRMNEIQEIIETLDKPNEQVMIESKFVEITGREADNKGVDWQSLAGYALQAESLSRTFSNERTRTSGLETASGFDRDNLTQPTLRTKETDLTLTDWTGESKKLDTAVFSADAFRVVISALETNTDVELVSNPTVVTMNNYAATIHIGEEFPIPDYTYNQERGTFEISGFEYKPIGITLDVTPQINSAGFINLEIEPNISTRTGQVEFGGASGAVIPIITTRKTQSSVAIKSGYTLAIGGLIETRDELTDSKVPLLGDIPGLGRLFKKNGKQTDRRNLIVFITAKILSASGATYRDVFSDRTLNEMGISSRDLPGYEPPPGEKELFDSIQRARDEVERLEAELELRGQLQALDTEQESNLKDIEKQKAGTGYNQ